jgi:hypothetical protein
MKFKNRKQIESFKCINEVLKLRKLRMKKYVGQKRVLAPNSFPLPLIPSSFLSFLLVFSSLFFIFSISLIALTIPLLTIRCLHALLSHTLVHHTSQLLSCPSAQNNSISSTICRSMHFASLAPTVVAIC